MAMSYVSTKQMKVESTLLSVTYYIVAFLLLCYVVLYSIVIKKGYHEHDTMVGIPRVKVKGSAYGSYVGNENKKLFDAIDLVETQSNQVMMATTLINTAGQKPDTCDGEDKDGLCACPLGSVQKCCPQGDRSTNGVLTGKCGAGGKFCEVRAWCPLETNWADEDLPAYALHDVRNWTVFVQMDGMFPKFAVSRSNVENPHADPIFGTNLWTVQTLVDLAKADWDILSAKGGRLLMRFEYDCNLDLDESECNPDITVTNLQSGDQNVSSSSGYNQRDAHYYSQGATQLRDLHKKYGISLQVEIYGQAGRFSVVALSITLGAGIGLLSLATVVCDFMLRYLAPGRETWNEAKYHTVRAKTRNSVDNGENSALLTDSEPEPSSLQPGQP